jgi:intergrase/recombinase
MGQIVKFCVLTGLRPSECVESVRLLLVDFASKRKQYYNPERQRLEHFRFPNIFFRATKKAYISYVSADVIESVVKLADKQMLAKTYSASSSNTMLSYNRIRLACRRKAGIMCDMRYCRRIFASWLHKHGISDVTVDMLQGRTSKSVLAQHYITPDNTMKDRVLSAVQSLKEELEAA